MRKSDNKNSTESKRRGWKDAGYLLLVIYALLLCPVVLSLSGCGSRGMRHDVPEIHRAAFEDASNRARRDAINAGAPVYDKAPSIRVHYQEGEHYSKIPCTDINGYGIRPGAADFILGKNYVLPLHNGQPQPDYWYFILLHYWIKGNEAQDYVWINKITGSCLDSSTPR